MIKQAPEYRRLRQFKRMLQVAFIVQERPCSTAIELRRDLVAEYGFRFCLRTLTRDLAALEDLGIVESRSVVQGIDHNRRVRVFEFADDLRQWPFPAGYVGQDVPSRHQLAPVRTPLNFCGAARK